MTDAETRRPSASEGRPLRADARRNRERVVDSARKAFATDGSAATLEAIAADAGVGIGTLYRHFATRELLVEAVYAAELDKAVESAGELLDLLPPDQALREWMRRYGAFTATKSGMLDTLRAGWSSGRLDPPVTRERVTGAVGSILEVGAADGTLRADVRADDVTSMLLGIFLATARNESPEQTERLLDLLSDALRPAGRSA